MFFASKAMPTKERAMNSVNNIGQALLAFARFFVLPFNQRRKVSMKSIASKTNSSILVRSMIVLAVLIGSTAFLLSPPPTHADSVPFYSFSGYSDGAEPLGGLVQGSDGNFYGTTRAAGRGGGGTVFKITSGGSLTTLYRFNGSDGASPWAGLVQGSDRNFYGTTANGGNGYGTVFKITSGGSLTSLYSFSYSDGAHPQAGLVQGRDGNFY